MGRPPRIDGTITSPFCLTTCGWAPEAVFLAYCPSFTLFAHCLMPSLMPAKSWLSVAAKSPPTRPEPMTVLPTRILRLARRHRGNHNRRMAIKRGDKLILSLGGVIAVPVVAATDERYATVMIRHENTGVYHAHHHDFRPILEVGSLTPEDHASYRAYCVLLARRADNPLERFFERNQNLTPVQQEIALRVERPATGLVRSSQGTVLQSAGHRTVVAALARRVLRPEKSGAEWEKIIGPDAEAVYASLVSVLRSLVAPPDDAQSAPRAAPHSSDTLLE